MKGIRISILLVLVLACIGASAQKKNVDAAWKLVGKTDGLAESRKLIKEAMAHDKTKDQARTWFVAAMIEWGSYDADVRKREINPKDLSVKDADMTAKLLDGYRYLLKALPLDSLPDRKGRVKPKYSAQILAALDGKAYDLYHAGAISYAAKNYYPQAYDGFMAAASLATNPRMIRAQRMLPDTLRREIYYYAGLSAYGGNEPRRALRAFNRAEELGKDSAPMYLYSMAIWEKFARDSISLRDESRDSLLAISTRGYRRHGIREPEFLNRMTQIYISAGRTDSIRRILDRQVQLAPDEWLPLGLRGWVNESEGRMDAAVIDYKLAAEHPDMSAKMLMRGAHTLYRVAQAKKDLIKGTRKQRRQMSQDLIDVYLAPAANMARRAKEKTDDTRELELIDNILDSIDYLSALLR